MSWISARSATVSSVRAQAEVQKRPLTTADGISARRILAYWYGRDTYMLADAVKVSPDGKRYLLILTQADLSRNGNWITFWSGETESLKAARPRIVAKLFTSSTNVNPLLDRRIDWFGNEQIAFPWDNGRNAIQILTLNLRTGALRPLVGFSRDVFNYSATTDGKMVIFSAAVKPSGNTSAPQYRSGFAVADNTVLPDLFTGLVSGNSFWHQDVFVSGLSAAKPRRITLPDNGVNISPLFQVQLFMAPNGKYAIVTAPPQSPPDSWSSYEDHYFEAGLQASRKAPSQPSALEQYWLVDIQSGKARPLWDAPERLGGSPLSWSPDSRSIVVGPTFLPLSATSSAAARAGSAIAIVDVATGRFTELNLPQGYRTRDSRPAQWRGPGVVELGKSALTGAPSDAPLTLSFCKQAPREWGACAGEAVGLGKASRVRLELRQDVDAPPQLYGTDTVTGDTSLLLDVNSELRSKFLLGKIALVHWKAKDGRSWTGKLYYPTGYSEAKRYPLVIMGGYVKPFNEFSLSGFVLNMTAGGAEALANRGIAVLLTDRPDDWSATESATPAEFRTVIAGDEGAIDQLVGSGLVDPNRIGISGVSRYGDYVAHFITQSQYPLAAALLADNLDDSYLQYIAWGAQTRAGIAKNIGGEPVEQGFQAWFENAPGFNVNKIHFPVRFERDSPGLAAGALASWEMFSQLRYLRRPTELYFVPNIEHGAHALTRPDQLLASQEGTVDWFDFWLNGHEDAIPKKDKQYRRWESLCDMQLAQKGGRPTSCVSTKH